MTASSAWKAPAWAWKAPTKLCVDMSPAGPDCLKPSTTFNVDVSECGDPDCSTATIETYPADQFTPPVAQGIDQCTGCDCVCRCVCITYDSPACDREAVVCFDTETETWSTLIECPSQQIDLTFALRKNEYSGDCELVLSSTELGIDPDDPGIAQDPGCPHLSGSWEISDEPPITVSIACVNCFGACGTPCCYVPPSETLTCTITIEEDCPCGDGTIVSLSYNSFKQKWIGTAPFGDCGMEIKLELWCVPPDDPAELTGWFLYREYSDGCEIPETFSPIHIWPSECGPLLLEWLISEHGSVGGCCPYGGMDPNLLYTITE